MSVLCWKCVYALVCPTIEREGLGEGQNSDVPAVVINVSIYKGQVAAVVNNGLHLRHVSIDWLIIDGAQQHTPAINKAIPPSMENFFLVFAQTHITFFTNTPSWTQIDLISLDYNNLMMRVPGFMHDCGHRNIWCVEHWPWQYIH